jgi:DNA (cytosine-5)-methyltransferase 1
MKIGSLFSGIGGLELGLEWSGIGETVWQVEQCPKLRNCLAHHWPDAERFDDVRTVGKHNLEPVDLICGGFPCQDVSSAGKRVGLSGSRSGLWSEFARIVSELNPRWVVVENVASGATKWVDAVRRDLEKRGYGSLPVPLSAADCGAWHERARVFLVAHNDDTRPRAERQKPRNHLSQDRSVATKEKAASYSDGLRQLQQKRSKPDFRRWPRDSIGRWIEPSMVRMVHGISRRVDRERALGNSVVPQQAQVVGEVIKLLLNAEGGE